MTAPAALAHEAIYDTVERLLNGSPRGRLLDVPAGEGALAVRLSEMGFEVSCCDLYPEIFRVDSWIQVMLGQRLNPAGWHRIGALMSEGRLKQTLDELATSIAGRVDAMPGHQRFLQSYCPAPTT